VDMSRRRDDIMHQSWSELCAQYPLFRAKFVWPRRARTRSQPRWHKKVSLGVFPLNDLSTMSDDADYHIEQTDAGASSTIPMEAGQIKKGG